MPVAAIKEDAPEWVALFTYANGAARVTSRTEFHRHLRVLRGFPSVSSPDRPALHACRLHARTHARTYCGVRFAERRTRDDSKRKGAASGVNEHDIRRQAIVIALHFLVVERFSNRRSVLRRWRVHRSARIRRAFANSSTIF